MGEYKRSTRELKIDGITPEAKTAIQKHLELYNLGSILDDALVCIEATSEKIKKGLFSGPGGKLVKSTVILTPRWLVQVIKTDAEPAFARSAQLRDITVEDYEKSPFYSKLPDTGINITGRFTDTSENGTSFLGLGKDSAGETFKSVLVEAIKKAKA